MVAKKVDLSKKSRNESQFAVNDETAGNPKEQGYWCEGEQLSWREHGCRQKRKETDV